MNRVLNPIIIDKDIFDEIYECKYPLPNHHDYRALAEYYQDKYDFYEKMKGKINNIKHKDKFNKIIEKYRNFHESQIRSHKWSYLSEISKDKTWTSIKVGRETKKILDMMKDDYNRQMTNLNENSGDGVFIANIKTIDELLQPLILYTIFSTPEKSKEDKWIPYMSTLFYLKYDKLYSEYINKAAQMSKNSGERISLGISKFTRTLLELIEDQEMFENKDEVLYFLFELDRSKEFWEFKRYYVSLSPEERDDVYNTLSKTDSGSVCQSYKPDISNINRFISTYAYWYYRHNIATVTDLEKNTKTAKKPPST